MRTNLPNESSKLAAGIADLFVEQYRLCTLQEQGDRIKPWQVRFRAALDAVPDSNVKKLVTKFVVRVGRSLCSHLSKQFLLPNTCVSIKASAMNPSPVKIHSFQCGFTLFSSDGGASESLGRLSPRAFRLLVLFARSVASVRFVSSRSRF